MKKACIFFITLVMIPIYGISEFISGDIFEPYQFHVLKPTKEILGIEDSNAWSVFFLKNNSSFLSSPFFTNFTIDSKKENNHATKKGLNHNSMNHNQKQTNNNAVKDSYGEAHMNHELMGMKRLPYSWKNPKIKPSAPPLLTGTQMGVVETLGIAPLGYEMDGDVKVFKLIAQPVEQFITDGKTPDYDKFIKEKNKPPNGLMHHSGIVQKLKAWGFNGTTPGPTIECNEGDRIRIVVVNELPEPMSVHKHGIELPVDQDGEAGFEEPVIMPGEEREYEFTLYQSGTYFYHGEFNLMKAASYGLTGALVVHPKKYEHTIDKQFVITLQEWRILPGNADPDLVSMDFNWFTFNGRAAPSIPAMTVQQFERVRIRIINMSMDNHPIHIHGHTWWVVGTEAGPIPKSAQWPVNSVDIPPGASRDVEFIAWNPGLWFFHCHKVHHVMNAHANVPLGVMPHGGMFTIFHVIPKDPDAPWQHPKETGWDVSRDGHDD